MPGNIRDDNNNSGRKFLLCLGRLPAGRILIERPGAPGLYRYLREEARGSRTSHRVQRR